jgi:hypothetical protein
MTAQHRSSEEIIVPDICLKPGRACLSQLAAVIGLLWAQTHDLIRDLAGLWPQAETTSATSAVGLRAALTTRAKILAQRINVQLTNVLISAD